MRLAIDRFDRAGAWRERAVRAHEAAMETDEIVCARAYDARAVCARENRRRA